MCKVTIGASFALSIGVGVIANYTKYIKVNVQPWSGNNGSSFGRNLNQQTSYIYKSAGGRTQARPGSPTSTKYIKLD